MFGFKRRRREHGEVMWALQEMNLRATTLHNDAVYHHALTHESLRHVLGTLHRIEEHMATRQQMTDMGNRLVASTSTFSAAVDALKARHEAKLVDAVNADDPSMDGTYQAMGAAADRLDAAAVAMNSAA